MELADHLTFEIALEVEFRVKEVKEHENMKALVSTFIVEAGQLVKETQRLTNLQEFY